MKVWESSLTEKIKCSVYKRGRMMEYMTAKER